MNPGDVPGGCYDNVILSRATQSWNQIPIKRADQSCYAWVDDSTYIQEPALLYHDMSPERHEPIRRRFTTPACSSRSWAIR